MSAHNPRRIVYANQVAEFDQEIVEQVGPIDDHIGLVDGDDGVARLTGLG